MWERIRQLFGPGLYQDPQDARRALLLTITLAIIIVVSLLDGLIVLIQPPEGQDVILTTLGITLLLSIAMLLFLVWTKQVSLVSTITGTFFMAIAIINLFVTGGLTAFVTAPGIITGMIFASLLIGRRGTILFTALAIFAFLAAYEAEINGIIVPPVANPNLQAQLAILIFITLFVGALVYYAQLGLDQAFERLEQSNERLALFNTNLEGLVQARTRDLQLVAEIGTKVDQIRELHPMLNQAVNLIQTEFKLYHVQVYLVDATLRSLILQASTGKAGEQMLRQHHRLAIGPGSVNGTAASRRQAVLISDVRNNPNHQPNPLLPHTTVELAVPLQIGSRLLGILDMQDTSAQNLTAENIPTFELLGQQLSVAIENARLFSELEMTQQKVIQQAQRLIDREWDTYFDQIQSTEHLEFQFENPAIDQVEEEGPQVDVPIKLAGVQIGHFTLKQPPSRPLTDDDQSFLQAVAEQVAQRVDNLRLLNETSRYREEAQTALKRMTLEAWQQFAAQNEANVQGFVAEDHHFSPLSDRPLPPGRGDRLPLVVQGQKIGEVSIDGPHFKTNHELISEVTNSLSSHIENLRLSMETERRASELAIINRVNDAIRGFIDLGQVYDAVATELRRSFGASSVYIATHEPGSDYFEIPYFITTGEDGEVNRPVVPRSKIGEGLTSKVITTRRPLLINADSQDDLIKGGAKRIDRSAPHDRYSFLAVPIITNNQVIGVLSIQDSTGRRFFSEDDRELLETISTSLGITMENARLYRQTQEALNEAQRQSRELEAINRVVLATGSANTLEESLQIVADELREVTSADQIGIALYDAERNELIVHATSGGENQEEVIGMTIPVVGNAPTEEVMRTRQPLIIENVPQSPIMEPVREIMEARQVEAVGIFPIYTPKGILGTIGLDITEPGKSFSADEINLTAAIVRQTATLIESARLFSETEKRARRERLINEITQKIQGAVTVENALQATVTELGKALRAHYVRVEINKDIAPLAAAGRESLDPVQEDNGTVKNE